MRPQTISITGTGETNALKVDFTQDNFKIGFGVVINGTVDYTVQHTFDDPNKVTPTWFDNEVVVNQIDNQDGNFAYPIRALRLVNNSGTGTSTMTILQGH